MAHTQPNAARPHTSTSILGVGDSIGTGDSYLIADILPQPLADVAFERMKTEVKWDTMHHRGGEVPRLVAVEGEVGLDGSFPIYRHPADESPPLSPFSPTVALIRAHVEKALHHPVNHVLIQYYRTGKDYISDHSDKTIDVVRGSSIVNVSIGAQRVMVLRLKRDRDHDTQSAQQPQPQSQSQTSANHPPPRPTQRIPLPHNSMFVLGPHTNAHWLHGIPHDARPLTQKSPAEQAYAGARISLTFRHIGTFLSPSNPRAHASPSTSIFDPDLKPNPLPDSPSESSGALPWIWGQGATGKTRAEAHPTGGDPAPLLRAFGEENFRNGDHFIWERWYGAGFDVVHFKE